MQFEIYRDNSGETRYRKRADNSEIYGDGYRDQTDAVRGATAEVCAILELFAPALLIGKGGDLEGQVIGVDERHVEKIIKAHAFR